MKNLNFFYKRNDGFTLIEILLSLAIASMISVSIYSMLGSSFKINKNFEDLRDLDLKASYAIEFIKGEVRTADKIIKSSSIAGFSHKYQDNLDFIIVREINGLSSYVSYYLKNGKLVRISLNDQVSHPNASNFSGNNILCENVLNISGSEFYPDKRKIKLKFKLGFEDNFEDSFESTIYVRCLVQ